MKVTVTSIKGVRAESYDDDVFTAPTNVSSQDCSERDDEVTVSVGNDGTEDDYLPFNHENLSFRPEGLNRQSYWDPEPREWICQQQHLTMQHRIKARSSDTSQLVIALSPCNHLPTKIDGLSMALVR